jgi:alkylation response protein AidB-like acyl-CoA dehydrogenase
MRLGDNETQRAFRTGLREWLRTHVTPTDPGTPRRWDLEDLRAWSKSLYDAGYAGLSWPAEHGGRGLSPVYQAIFAEECALAQAPDHANVIGLNMVGPTIVRYGTEAQKSMFLPRILSGDALFCQGFSEPDAGSDLAAVRLSATPCPEGYRLDGEKVWSSYAHLADYCLLLARTDTTAPKHDGMTCFLLDMHAPGVEVRPLRQISGDADFNQIVLTGVVVPVDSMLGPLGAGWRVALTTLAHERGTFGITLTARLSVQFDRVRQTVEAVGADRDPAVRRELAELYVALQALRYTGYRALATLDRTGEPGPESTILKLRWSQAYQRLTAFAVCLLGAHGALDGESAFWNGYWQRERLRSAAATIEGGTSEILRSIVAERVLGLPRSR